MINIILLLPIAAAIIYGEYKVKKAKHELRNSNANKRSEVAEGGPGEVQTVFE